MLDDAVVLYSFRQSYIFGWLCCSSILYCFVYYILSCLFNFIIVQIAYSRLRMNRLGLENVNGILFYQIKFYWHCSRHDLVALGCRRFGGDCSRLKSLYHIHGLVTQVAMNTSLSQRFKCALYSNSEIDLYDGYRSTWYLITIEYELVVQPLFVDCMSQNFLT